MKGDEGAGEAGERRRDRERHELVGVSGIAQELRAGLVLADGDEDRADRRANEALQDDDDGERDDGNEAVPEPIVAEVEAERRAAHDAAEPVLAAGEGRPSERRSRRRVL